MPNNIQLYRMTHIDNIPHIIQYGITHRNSMYANHDYVSIGDQSLIGVRSVNSHVIHGKEVVLGDCIPFYFGTRMPMLYVIQHGYNWVPRAISPADIIYVVVSLNSLMQDVKVYYFTDGHPTNTMTKFYDNSDIDHLLDLVDMNAVQAKYWNDDPSVSDVKRRKQAEFLSTEDVAPKHILGYGCYNLETKSKLLGFGIPDNKILINPKCYF